MFSVKMMKKKLSVQSDVFIQLFSLIRRIRNLVNSVLTLEKLSRNCLVFFLNKWVKA